MEFWLCDSPLISTWMLRKLGEKERATHSSILAWKIPWTEEPGRLQCMGSQRVGHDWATSLSLFQVRQAQQVGNETRNPRPTGSACAQWAPPWAGFFPAGLLFLARCSQCWGGTPHPLAFSRSAETAPKAWVERVWLRKGCEMNLGSGRVEGSGRWSSLET